MAQREHDNDDGGVAIKDPVKSPEKLKPPRKWAVILLNDDFTTFDFVIEVLASVFHKKHEEAQALAMEIHKQGSAVAGVYTHEIAETKAAHVNALADSVETPLRADLEAM